MGHLIRRNSVQWYSITETAAVCGVCCMHHTILFLIRSIRRIDGRFHKKTRHITRQGGTVRRRCSRNMHIHDSSKYGWLWRMYRRCSGTCEEKTSWTDTGDTRRSPHRTLTTSNSDITNMMSDTDRQLFNKYVLAYNMFSLHMETHSFYIQKFKKMEKCLVCA